MSPRVTAAVVPASGDEPGTSLEMVQITTDRPAYSALSCGPSLGTASTAVAVKSAVPSGVSGLPGMPPS